jgi:hypothetical protein
MVDFRFDEGFDEPAAPARGERLDVPEGVHDFLIKQVIDEGERIQVRLEHGDRRYGWVFCRLLKQADWAKRLVRELAKALGMTQEEWLLADVGDIAGRRVRAEIVHVQKDKLFVNVNHFLPIEEIAQEAAAKAKARAPAAKATAALSEQVHDDIPF